MRLFILHNIISPLRLPLFQKLNELYDIHVYFCSRNDNDRLWKTSLINAYAFKYYVLPNFKLKSLTLNHTLLFRLLNQSYDAYLVGENSENIFSILITLFVVKLLKKPLILWTGAFETQYYRKKWGNAYALLNIYHKFIYNHSDAFVAYSELSKLFLMKNGVSESKIFVGGQVLHNKTNKNNITITVPDIFIGKKNILYLGYLRKGKGIDLLINAYKKLHLKNTMLIIAGTGPEESNLKKIANDDSTIHFVGYVEGAKKVLYYSIAHLFVLPTYHDSWGLVINEAMYYGLPIIVSSAAAASEMVTDNGYVIPPGDEQALFDALHKLLLDDSLRLYMGIKSKQNITGYTLDTGVLPFIRSINYVFNSR